MKPQDIAEITVSAPENEEFKAAEDVVIPVSVSKANQDITFSDEIEKSLDENNNILAIDVGEKVNIGIQAKTNLESVTDPDDGTFVYENGEISVNGEGSASIKFTAEENDYYNEAVREIIVKGVIRDGNTYDEEKPADSEDWDYFAISKVFYCVKDIASDEWSEIEREKFLGYDMDYIQDLIKNNALKICHGWKFVRKSQEIVAPDSMNILEGEQMAIEAKAKTPLTYNVADQDKDEDVIEVDAQTGIVTAKSAGNAKVIISTSDKEKWYKPAEPVSILIKVQKSRTINVPDKITKAIGNEPFSIEASLSEGEGVISYESSDRSIATIDETGVVTIHQAGTVVITTTAIDEKGVYADTAAEVNLVVSKPATPKLNVKAIGKKKIKLDWNSVTGATGYQICVAQNSKFTKKKQTKNVGKVITIKNTKLKKGKRYYYKIRAKVKTADGTTYYSNWSSVKSAKVK